MKISPIRVVINVIVSLLLAGLISILTVSVVVAHGTTDQSNSIWGFSAWRSLEQDKVFGQTFIPAEDNIVGVDLELKVNSITTETVTVSIRESSGNVPEDFTGKLITSVTQSVELPATVYPEFEIVHFDFPSRTALDIGKTYVLEVKALEGNGIVQWVASVDHYQGGIVVIDEGFTIWEASFADWGFATYYTEQNNKADILKGSGVTGKGIDKAPGLQKEFNEKSKATENAGKKKIK